MEAADNSEMFGTFLPDYPEDHDIYTHCSQN